MQTAADGCRQLQRFADGCLLPSLGCVFSRSPNAVAVPPAGPTGQHLIDGLLERKHRVWMLHSGTHPPLTPEGTPQAWYSDGRVQKLRVSLKEKQEQLNGAKAEARALSVCRSLGARRANVRRSTASLPFDLPRFCTVPHWLTDLIISFSISISSFLIFKVTSDSLKCEKYQK